ncbi:MAG: hypothetical protein DLM68_03235 [Hyphomicrobiales bacterium]|nr:MAG: hypothetical protein DLM68_03235 [Hyphomicrobiales bacterium]
MPGTPESPKRESPGNDRKKRLDRELDRELADSFPASDPPSVTQPGIIPGGPERKIPGGE